MFQIGTIQDFEEHMDFMERLSDRIRQILRESCSELQRGVINIIGISSEEIQKLNKIYRNKDSSTDILTFPYFEDFSECKEQEVAGEILICLDKVTEQAKEKNITENEELQILLIHGFVHMLGYDHETEEEYNTMSEIEKKLQAKLGE